eukprot:CAMPEP_0183506762 /NCGR_PEP_ID=MMETSP0371-20130417/7705_1 /TAXON_ID=268820 /ORGANISM="Peridinium aciculiferum, Strain PAER-2" /LENGTH=384 /DNA_ID=CAMNT_0025702803 /DNA_START=62 /DNA_END=1216 /DNA_ORIENTATION=+
MMSPRGGTESYQRGPPGGRPFSDEDSRVAGPIEGCIGTACGNEMCFEPEGQVQTVNWVYAGEGQGGYDKIQNFNFVGDGRGSYESHQVVTPYGWKVRPVCVGLFCVLALVVAGYVVRQSTTATSTMQARSAQASGADMLGGLTGASCEAMELTEQEADICCQSFRIRCFLPPATVAPVVVAPVMVAPTPAPTAYVPPVYVPPVYVPPPTPVPAATPPPYVPPPEPAAEPGPSATFDCSADYLHWVLGWSPTKKVWCCQQEQKGCFVSEQLAPVPAPAPAPAVALAVPTPSAAPTPPPPTAAPTTTKPLYYDCTENFANWGAAWSVPKKAWCCMYGGGRGCPAGYSTTSGLFDCVLGLANWEHAWTPAKKYWCCGHGGEGCEASG